MARKFYTEHDIEDMVKSGVTSLEINDCVTLTEYAYEKARRLGLTLIQVDAKNPSAPIRPYLSRQQGSAVSAVDAKPCDCNDICQNPKPAMSAEVKERIRSAVLNRLGGQVDADMLDRIIDRVLSSTGVK
jgi:hypothetical protein